MSRSLWSSGLTRLVASHAVALALALALAAGNAYFVSQRRTTESILAMITRKPVADAANIAFRFGPPEHARILLEELRRAPADPEFASGDVMFIELQLAVLDGEHQSPATSTPHLASASIACQRFRKHNCGPTQLREVALKLAAQRRN